MLDLSRSKKLVEVHESLDDHKVIKSVKLRDCSELKEFPRIRDMVSLEELILCRTCLQSFPEITGNVNRLVKLDLDHTKITTLPWSIERATSLETISVRDCQYLLTLPLSSSLSLRSQSYSSESVLDRVRNGPKDLIVSKGMGQLTPAQIYFRVYESLKELPEIILSRVVFLHIHCLECPTLTRWICSNLVDLLHKYQHLCKLQLHREDRHTSTFMGDFLDDREILVSNDGFLKPFFDDVESMSNMLRERDNYFEVEVHVPGGRFPSGFQYRICGSFVNVFIKSIDKLRGICICGPDAKLTDKHVPSASGSSATFRDCDCINKDDSNVVVMYIPIDTIKGNIQDWDGQKECTLFELKSNLHWIQGSRRTEPIWGLSLVYNEGEGDVDQNIVITNDCLDWSNGCRMKLKIAERRGVREAVELDTDHYQGNSDSNNRIQLPLLNQQLCCVSNEGGSMVYGGPRIRGAAGEDRLGVPSSNFVAESSRDYRDNLDSLFCPPFALMNHGSFEEAKDTAKVQNKWLLLNLQSTQEFNSHRLNRDTWANEVVAEVIKTSFIFWQVNDDTEEGRKICTEYRIDAAPIISVIAPLTGQEMVSWHGMVQPQSLLEDLMPYLDRSPTDHPIIPAHKHRRVRINTQAPPLPWKDESNYDDEKLADKHQENVPSEKEMAEPVPDEEDMAMAKPNYLPLPEEPISDRNLLCIIGFRLPDGQRLRRNFLLTDPIQLLWSFCCTQLEEAKTRPFRLAQTIPGSKPLEYHSSVTLGDSGLANSMISVTWM